MALNGKKPLHTKINKLQTTDSKNS